MLHNFVPAAWLKMVYEKVFWLINKPYNIMKWYLLDFLCVQSRRLKLTQKKKVLIWRAICGKLENAISRDICDVVCSQGTVLLS